MCVKCWSCHCHQQRQNYFISDTWAAVMQRLSCTSDCRTIDLSLSICRSVFGQVTEPHIASNGYRLVPYISVAIISVWMCVNDCECKALWALNQDRKLLYKYTPLTYYEIHPWFLCKQTYNFNIFTYLSWIHFTI